MRWPVRGPASSASGCPAPPPTSPAARSIRTWCWSTSPAPSAPSRPGCRCPSATASSPTPPTRWCPVPEMFNYWLQGGRIDVGFLGAAQVDRFANINTTVVDRGPDRPEGRLPGAGGAPEIAANCGQVLMVLRHARRNFVGALDFVTTLGHGSGPGDRAALGLPGAGPIAVITDLGVLRPDPRHRGTRPHRAAPGRDGRSGAGGHRLGPQGRRPDRRHRPAHRRRTRRPARPEGGHAHPPGAPAHTGPGAPAHRTPGARACSAAVPAQ